MVRTRAKVASLGALAVVIAVMCAPGASAAQGRVAIGVYQSGAPQHPALIDSFARKIGRDPVVVGSFFRWDETLVARDQLRAVAARGAVPLVTWEPWHVPLEGVTAGEYDTYIRTSARDAAAYGGPILLRLAPEMNGDWVSWGLGVGGNTSADFIAAWRHVVSVFRREGADNVRWVWSPNVMDAEGNQKFGSLYPGDRWVDWVGLDGYNWGIDIGWRSFSEIFGPSYEVLTRLSSKPVVIAETAANEAGGDKAAWITSAFGPELRQFKRVHAVVWFNDVHARNDIDWRVDSSPQALSAIRRALAAPRYGLTAKELLALKSSGAGGSPSVTPPSGGFGEPSLLQRFRDELGRGSVLAWCMLGGALIVALAAAALALRAWRRRAPAR